MGVTMLSTEKISLAINHMKCEISSFQVFSILHLTFVATHTLCSFQFDEDLGFALLVLKDDHISIR